MIEQILQTLVQVKSDLGILALTPGNVAMIGVGFLMLYLAVFKHIEPYELLPIGMGAILINLPLHQAGALPQGGIQDAGLLGIVFYYMVYTYNILPPLIFLGLGALTDFGALISNPRTIILGGAAQIGIFIAFLGALWLGFDLREAAAIGIIGGADGPTTIYLNAILAPHLLGICAVTGYSYISLVPFIQPPIMRLLTTKEERKIRMTQLRHVSRRAKIIFPVIVMVTSILLVPESAPLVSVFMIGNLFREAGVVERLNKSTQNEILNIATIFLMLCVGLTLKAETVFQLKTFKILTLGLIAFSFGTAGGILLAKFMNLFSKHKINPLIGAAGVSAVPIAARVAQEVAYREDPENHLLMHAMGPNVAGVIGSAIVAGYFLSVIPG
ncbi:MAG TPA: sodium ion-translocating decarboxylase subunit beta [bacterium]|nr:sodium ion-translocating decarboxylase subunit beta [bacterium]